MMARGPCTFRQRDVKAALKAAREAGDEVERVEIENGKIVLVMKPNGTAPETKQGGTREWEE